MVLDLTPRELQMQQRLFGIHRKRAVLVPDACVLRVLRELRAAFDLRTFRIWLVGSRLLPRRDNADIDLVLSPQPGTSPTYYAVENALFYCREYGLHRSAPACIIDPCFREHGPTVELVPLPADAMIKSIKLHSPRLSRLVREGRIKEWRRVGDIAIEFLRRADESDYYGKLPTHLFDRSRCPYLRPAVEILHPDDKNGPLLTACASTPSQLYGIMRRKKVAQH